MYLIKSWIPLYNYNGCFTLSNHDGIFLQNKWSERVSSYSTFLYSMLFFYWSNTKAGLFTLIRMVFFSYSNTNTNSNTMASRTVYLDQDGIFLVLKYKYKYKYNGQPNCLAGSKWYFSPSQIQIQIQRPARLLTWIKIVFFSSSILITSGRDAKFGANIRSFFRVSTST